MQDNDFPADHGRSRNLHGTGRCIGGSHLYIPILRLIERIYHHIVPFFGSAYGIVHDTDSPLVNEAFAKREGEREAGLAPYHDVGVSGSEDERNFFVIGNYIREYACISSHAERFVGPGDTVVIGNIPVSVLYLELWSDTVIARRTIGTVASAGSDFLPFDNDKFAIESPVPLSVRVLPYSDIGSFALRTGFAVCSGLAVCTIEEFQRCVMFAEIYGPAGLAALLDRLYVCNIFPCIDSMDKVFQVGYIIVPGPDLFLYLGEP